MKPRQTASLGSSRVATVGSATTAHLTSHDRSPWLTTLARGFLFAQRIKALLRDDHIKTLYIDPLCSWQNGYIERLHSHFRAELINRKRFLNLSDARIVIKDWRQCYNEEKPLGRLGHLGMKDILADQKVSPRIN